MTLAFVVYGTPIGQGRISFLGKGRAVHSNAKTLHPWRALVASRAAEAQTGMPYTGPVQLRASFYLQRPKHHSNSRGLRDNAPSHPAKRPDLDHLLRAIGDALTGIAWVDDSQVVKVRASKSWCAPDAALQEPGVVIEVHPAAGP